ASVVGLVAGVEADGVAGGDASGGGVVPAGAHVDSPGGGVGVLVLVSECGLGATRGGDHTEWAVAAGPGQGAGGGVDQGGEVGVQVGDRHRGRRALFGAEQLPAGDVAVERTAIAGDVAAGAGVCQ